MNINNTIKLALIGVFAGLAIVVNVAGPKIPAPYAPFLYYQLWEIPIVVAFLAVGPKEGVAIAGINALILTAYFPGALLLGPLYNLIAVLSMLAGIYIPYRIATRGCKAENLSSYLRLHIGMISLSATILGIILRVAVLTVVNYIALQQAAPVGFSLSSGETIAYLPLIAAFNASVSAYTVPIAIVITVAALAITSKFIRGKREEKN